MTDAWTQREIREEDHKNGTSIWKDASRIINGDRCSSCWEISEGNAVKGTRIKITNGSCLIWNREELHSKIRSS